MFCFQCEQTAKGTGCTMAGVCGKDGVTAGLQDLLLHATKGVAAYAARARRLGSSDKSLSSFIVEALFTTVTNVNFDPERLSKWLSTAAKMRDRARTLYEEACQRSGQKPETLDGSAVWEKAGDLDGLVQQADSISISKRRETVDHDLVSLQEIVTYGLKGAAAYAEHARLLGREDDELSAGFEDHLAYLTRRDQTMDELLSRCLAVGALNLRAMELLDAAHTSTFGHPEPTSVRIEPVKGKAILVSGHDLLDLFELLKQTQGTGINVYTHGEMLPAHGYPKLKAFAHLVGNYGGAWQDQAREFAAFPGAVLMTTNCIQRPLDSYTDRIFTAGLVAWPGVAHVEGRDFSPVIKAAMSKEGFSQDGPDRRITVGFGHQAVMNVASHVIEAVKSGAVRHFFLVGGCDGAKPGRNYFTDFAQAVPKDCVILTLACGKYRFNKLPFGSIGPIPRLLDIGQCNDAYSAVQIAMALSKAFQCGVNDLPLSLVLSWYEQKAVAILLTLLHLGLKNIRLGPSLPAFITPNVLNVLVDKFQIKPIGTAKGDLEEILGRAVA